MKHLLKLKDLTSDEIFGILNLADQLKYERKNNVKHPYLEGTNWAATRCFFPTAICRSAEASPSRIPSACFRAISTAS